MYEIVRCDDCGGALECKYAEREFTGMCKCPNKNAVKARAQWAAPRARKERMTLTDAREMLP